MGIFLFGENVIISESETEDIQELSSAKLKYGATWIEHMKITICASIAFIDEMSALKQQLEQMGHEVKMPPLTVPNEQGKEIPVKEYYTIRKNAKDSEKWVWDLKAKAMRTHYEKIEWADSIIVLNQTKNNVMNYVGANTLVEMGIAFFLNKPIYFMHPIPEQSSKEEILGMKPIILNENLNILPS